LIAGHKERSLPGFLPRSLLGHKSVKTTMIYTHVLNRGGRGVTSPVDVPKQLDANGRLPADPTLGPVGGATVRSALHGGVLIRQEGLLTWRGLRPIGTRIADLDES
jgi:hypothetical protein